MESAIHRRNFPEFAELTMCDSNSFHATCLDTWSPIFYMNDVSHAAVHLVHDIKKVAGRTVCAYTFDAGRNAVVYYLEKDSDIVAGTFKGILSSNTHGSDGQFGEPVENEMAAVVDTEQLDPNATTFLKEGLGRVIDCS